MTVDDERKISFKSKESYLSNGAYKTELSTISNGLLNKAIQNSSEKLQSSLFVIKSYAQLLQRTQDVDRLDRGVKLMENSSEKMDLTIQALLSLMHLYTNEKPISDLVFFQEVYDKVIVDMYEEIKASEVTIEVDFEEHAKVWFPNEYLTVIVREIISNSILHNIYVDDLVIKLKSYKLLNSVILEVTDNGGGFVFPTDKAEIREPFNNLSKLDQCQGVGLSKIEAILKRTDCAFDIESSIGEGTTCRFYFNQ